MWNITRLSWKTTAIRLSHNMAEMKNTNNTNYENVDIIYNVTEEKFGDLYTKVILHYYSIHYFSCFSFSGPFFKLNNWLLIRMVISDGWNYTCQIKTGIMSQVNTYQVTFEYDSFLLNSPQAFKSSMFWLPWLKFWMSQS